MSAEIQADFKAYQDKVAAALVNVTKCANAISAYDLNFHRSYNENVSRSLDPQNAHLLRLTSKLLKAATKETNLKAPVLKDRDDVEDEWRPIVDVVDDQLEKADAALDEVNGLIKRQSPLQPSTPEPPAHRPRSNWHSSPYGMPKPQRLFDRKVDNFQTSRWQPLLNEKPHALVSLYDSIGSEETGFKHPYAYEIEQYKYPDRVYEKSPLIPFTHPGTGSPIWVDTEEGVRQMLQELKQAEEIAVDLEHNNTNSYIGIVCLMQISTRSKDWLVDTLKPWREKLQCLNEVFADPNILKVFHGSTSDMIWLQRDLGLYVVGLFDTFHAATALNYQQRSLAHLLDKFVNFKAQKQFQLADWRVRPLPQELLDYARSDTHYLLYIYDCMRNDLVQCSTPEKNLIDYVLENSKKEALQVYERHAYDRDNGLGPDGWLKILLSKSAKVLDKASFGIFRALHEWRDQKAREVDEGVHSIMSNTFMWNCAEVKPETKAQLFNPRVLGRASYYVTANQDEVIDVIKRGKREGLAGPTVQEVMDRNADRIASFRTFKNSNPQAKPQEIQQSIAATMQKLVKDGDLSVPAKADPEEPVALRSTCSTLFGPMSLSRSLSAHDPVATNMAAESLMPVSRFSITSPTTNGAHPESVALSPAVSLSTPSNGHVRATEEPSSDVPFILGDRKKKRSADDVEATDAADITDPTSDTDPTQSDRADDAERLTPKRQQKAAKQARKEAEKSDRDAAAASYTPFDYANAHSVLHAANQSETPTNLAPAKAFNPFAKALDTSTGAKRNRLGKEMAGKSHTFSS